MAKIKVEYLLVEEDIGLYDIWFTVYGERDEYIANGHIRPIKTLVNDNEHTTPYTQAVLMYGGMKRTYMGAWSLAQVEIWFQRMGLYFREWHKMGVWSGWRSKANGVKYESSPRGGTFPCLKGEYYHA